MKRTKYLQPEAQVIGFDAFKEVMLSASGETNGDMPIDDPISPFGVMDNLVIL